MIPGIYVGIVILAATIGFFLGERYGKKEVELLKAQLVSARKALDTVLDNTNKRLQTEASGLVTKVDTDINGVITKL